MTPITRYGFQHDLYQRYGFLRTLIDAMTRRSESAPDGLLQILDIGSGPVALTDAFLVGRARVVRADVDQFEQPEIVLITPGQPLPFESASVDLVLALDVLEHVTPEWREGLVRECGRVARRGVLFSHPAGRPEVIEAEAQFVALAREVTGQRIDFLDEHVRYGLPDVAAVSTWMPAGWRALVVDNAPLAMWLLFNLVDYLYSFEFGDGAEKREFNRRINPQTPFLQQGVPHYRTFVAAFADDGDAARVEAMVDAMRRAPVDVLGLSSACSDAVVHLHANLRNLLLRALPDQTVSEPIPFAAIVQQLRATFAHKDAQAAALQGHQAFLNGALSAKDSQIATLTGVGDGLRTAVAQKDAHIAGLTGHLDILQQTLAQKDLQIGEVTGQVDHLRQTLAERQGYVAALTDQVNDLQQIVADRNATLATLREQADAHRADAERLGADHAQASADLDRLRMSLDEARTDARAAAERLQSAREGDARRALEAQALRDTLHAVQADFNAVRRSRSWRMTAPLRTLGVKARLVGRRFRSVMPPGSARLVARLGRDRRTRAIIEASGLFDVDFYRQRNPDVTAKGVDPLGHFLRFGGSEGRAPHREFDSAYYLARNPDVAAARMNPLLHYLSSGAAEGRNPSAHFHTKFYVETYEDVRASRINPLVHYVRFGRAERRQTRPGQPTPTLAPAASSAAVRPPADVVGYAPKLDLLPWFNPLTAVTSDARTRMPTLNILLPKVGLGGFSGGPNTAFVLGCQLALRGVRVRFVSADLPLDPDRGPFLAHIRGLIGRDLPEGIELLDASNKSVPVEFGRNDLFLATAWWTAQQAKYLVRLTRHQRFLYLIQDFEPLLHSASTAYALALETYGLDHLPIVNKTLLRDFLVEQRIGRFADPQFSRAALAFEPAVDRAMFRPREQAHQGGRRRLLFYTRPQQAPRNLFELGVAALQKAIQDGTFDPAQWEFVGMGEPFAPVPLSDRAMLTPAPWFDLPGYARHMRESDLLLSLMLSPHPSYPPLEMAASAGLTVTTTFANKTAEKLARFSPNIIGVPPTIEDIAAGLATAISRLDDWSDRLANAAITLPPSWNESLEPIVSPLLDELAVLQGAPVRPREPGPGALARRRTQYPPHHEPGLISFLTTVWNTPADYLEALAESLFSQDAGTDFEWVLLDNGSEHPETRRALARIAEHPCVQFHRVDQNRGIIGGMRFCLERATNRYVSPVDSDDLLTPDCVRVATHALRSAGYPAIAYTDEDKLDGDHFQSPYLKPAWDPVLFASSCYIAHLGLIDREIALRVGTYTDPETEGSHDWDTFSRFLIAGHEPLHIPEVLYSWRIHAASTSGNIGSKPFVYDSQRRVLTKLLAARSQSGLLRVEPSPLFPGMPDWWMRRDATDPRPVTTVVLTARPGRQPRIPLGPEVPHTVVTLDPRAGAEGLLDIARTAASDGRLLHVLWGETQVQEDTWALEAMALFEIYPDAAMIGGRLHQNGFLLQAGCYFGFGRGCDAPDRGQPLNAPGYFAKALKQHSVSAVSLDHCVLDPVFAAEALPPLVQAGVSLAHLGPWLGAVCRRRQRRVVYSPFLVAEPASDVTSLVTDVEHEAFWRANSDLMPERQLLSPHLGLTHRDAYRPVAAVERSHRPGEPLPALSHDQDLDADRMTRRLRDARPDVHATFSLLTGVYARSPVEYLRQTAESVLAQSHRDFEWIILKDGPVPPELEDVLRALASDERVRLLTHEHNAGIISVLRSCLQQARMDYIVPLDADDLLEPDALALLASALGEAPLDFVFSDEDHLTDGRLHARLSRDGFDPVLNIESSLVWHLCAFRRERGLALGAYTDPGAEYCHDWDTTVRFAMAGSDFGHVPHVLYHWRSHAASKSHSGVQHPGTVKSTRAVLERIVAATPMPDRYEIAEFPIDRGAVEWWIRRKPGHASPICAIVPLPRAVSTREDWQALALRLPPDAELLAMVDIGLAPRGEGWLEEAIKWFELVPDAAIVSGRVLDEKQYVVDAGLVERAGNLERVYKGRRRTDPAPFALALKPQTIAAPSEGFFVLRRSVLVDAIDTALRDGFTAPLGETLGRIARAHGQRVIYAPLLEACPSAVPLEPGIVRPPDTADQAGLAYASVSTPQERPQR